MYNKLFVQNISQLIFIYGTVRYGIYLASVCCSRLELLDDPPGVDGRVLEAGDGSAAPGYQPHQPCTTHM